MAIYTRTGDRGTTGLLSGNRQKKNNTYITVNGHIDELTSHLGMAKAIADQDIKDVLSDLQQRLIEIMGHISGEFKTPLPLGNDIEAFENGIDSYSELYPEPGGFILPGDSEASARLDVARTIARRAERALVSLDDRVNVPEDVIRYFNRLSDYLYSMARMIDFRVLVKEQLMSGSTQYAESGMASAAVLNLEMAKRIAHDTEREATDRNMQVVICVTGKEGLPHIILKMDDAFPVSFNLARKKAYTSAVLKMPTHELAKLTAEGGDFQGLEDMLDEEIVTLGGGYPIMSQGKTIGAIGVSGGTAQDDIELARYGSLTIGRMNE